MATPNIVNVATINAKNATGAVTTSRATAVDVSADKVAKINTILIGPEGGFSFSEINFLKSLDYVFSFSLGKRVLRADTAAICALALLRSKKN